MRAAPTLPALLIAALLGGCGARQAQPVAEASPLDERLSCEHLAGELGANEARRTELVSEGERRSRDNLGQVLLFGPIVGLSMADDGRTQQSESDALIRRNARLRGLQQARGCAAG